MANRHRGGSITEGDKEVKMPWAVTRSPFTIKTATNQSNITVETERRVIICNTKSQTDRTVGQSDPCKIRTSKFTESVCTFPFLCVCVWRKGLYFNGMGQATYQTLLCRLISHISNTRHHRLLLDRGPSAPYRAPAKARSTCLDVTKDYVPAVLGWKSEQSLYIDRPLNVWYDNLCICMYLLYHTQAELCNIKWIWLIRPYHLKMEISGSSGDFSCSLKMQPILNIFQSLLASGAFYSEFFLFFSN